MILSRATSIHPENLGLSLGAEPVRKIRPRSGRKTMAGWFPSAKGTLPSLRTETLLELDGLEQFEINPDCVLMATQPHSLIWFETLEDGSTVRRRYTPDLAILMRDGGVAVIEFKIAHFADQEKWRRKAAILTEAYARDHFASFQTVTEQSVYVEPRRTNAAVMMMHRAVIRDDEADVLLTALIDIHGLPTTIGELSRRAGLRSSEAHVDRAFSAIIGMALAGTVRLDLGVPLGDHTPVLAPHGAEGAR